MAADTVPASDTGANPEATSADLPPVSAGFMALYSFTQFAAWLAILTPVTITIALHIGKIATRAEKGAYLATTLSIGAFCAMVAAPIWGALSDVTRARITQRSAGGGTRKTSAALAG